VIIEKEGIEKFHKEMLIIFATEFHDTKNEYTVTTNTTVFGFLLVQITWLHVSKKSW